MFVRGNHGTNCTSSLLTFNFLMCLYFNVVMKRFYLCCLSLNYLRAAITTNHWCWKCRLFWSRLVFIPLSLHWHFHQGEFRERVKYINVCRFVLCDRFQGGREGRWFIPLDEEKMSCFSLFIFWLNCNGKKFLLLRFLSMPFLGQFLNCVKHVTIHILLLSLSSTIISLTV